MSIIEEKFLEKNYQYPKITWTDSSEPPLSAQNLNRIENALELLLGSEYVSNCIIRDIVDRLNTTDTSLSTNVSKLEEADTEIKRSIPTNVSQLNNDADYVNQQSLDGKADKQHKHKMVDIEDYENYLSEYAKKTEIPSLQGYATEQYVDDAINKIDIPEGDLTGYATEDFVVNELKSYATRADSILNNDEVVLYCGNATV